MRDRADEEIIETCFNFSKKINKYVGSDSRVANFTASVCRAVAGDKMNIEKTLNRDKERVIQSALREMYKDFDFYPYVFEIDSDKSEVYYEMWMDEGYKVFMLNYTMNADNTSATLSGEPVEVVSQTEYKTVSKSFVEEVVAGIAKYFGGTKRDSNPVETLVVIKQFDESNDEMIEISKLYCSPMEVDAHDDAMTEEEIRKMVANLDSNIQKGKTKGNFDHDLSKTTDKFSFVKAFVAECDCEIGGNYVAEGTPLIKVKYHDADLWKERKEGGYTGWSIGAKAKAVEYVEVDV